MSRGCGIPQGETCGSLWRLKWRNSMSRGCGGSWSRTPTGRGVDVKELYLHRKEGQNTALYEGRSGCVANIVTYLHRRRFLRTVNGGSSDSAYRLSGSLVLKAPVGRRYRVLWRGSIIDNLDLLVNPHTKLPYSVLERMTAWYSRSISIRSPSQDRPHKSLKYSVTFRILHAGISYEAPRRDCCQEWDPETKNGRMRFLRNRQESGTKPLRGVKCKYLGLLEENVKPFSRAHWGKRLIEHVSRLSMVTMAREIQ
jgi:hypothetical protein